jgi:3-dehydroquinate dehydratase/shikimate dehydrogenase
MNQGKICVSVCASTAAGAIEQMRRAESFADLIEVRFDCLGESEIRTLAEALRSISKQLLITFRPVEQGGKRPLTLTERIKFWEFIVWQLKGVDFVVDYEFDIDLPLGFDAERAIVSMHDFKSAGEHLSEQLEAIAGVTGKTIKVAVMVNDASDAIAVWDLLRNEDRRVIPIAMGEAGKWTRILGLAHGSPMTYASLDAGHETAPGQISAKDLRDIFRAKELDRDTKVYGVIAGDTSYSLSPYMHNAAFKHAGLNSVFVPLQVGDLGSFIRRMVKIDSREVELNFRGFSVTNPHKQAIINHLDHVDETARAIGAVNTVKVEDGRLFGFNTDAPGFIKPLKSAFGDLIGARAAVVGAGGAARACVYALKQEGADVTLLARDTAKASSFADEFGIRVEALTTDHRPLTTDVLVNATPLGTRGEREDETIATADELRDVRLVYDLVYNPSETRLLREARVAGAKTLGGLDMLIAQGATQFQIWTGEQAPVEEMREAVRRRLE